MSDIGKFISDRRLAGCGFDAEAYEAELAKWERRGECKRCGRCCTAVGLMTSPLQSNRLNIAEDLKKKNPLAYKLIEHIKCPHVIIKDGKAVCTIYLHRPEFCYSFPEAPGDLVDGCGFYFVEKEGRDETR